MYGFTTELSIPAVGLNVFVFTIFYLTKILPHPHFPFFSSESFYFILLRDLMT